MFAFCDQYGQPHASLRHTNLPGRLCLFTAFVGLVSLGVFVALPQNGKHLAREMAEPPHSLSGQRVLSSQFSALYDVKASVHLEGGYGVLDVPDASSRLCRLMVARQLATGSVSEVSINAEHVLIHPFAGVSERNAERLDAQRRCLSKANSIAFRYASRPTAS